MDIGLLGGGSWFWCCFSCCFVLVCGFFCIVV